LGVQQVIDAELLSLSLGNLRWASWLTLTKTLVDYWFKMHPSASTLTSRQAFDMAMTWAEHTYSHYAVEFRVIQMWVDQYLT
jgi:hypothetical protein